MQQGCTWELARIDSLDLFGPSRSQGLQDRPPRWTAHQAGQLHPASMRPGRLRHEMWNACGAGEGWHLTGSGTKRVGLCWRPKRSKKCTALNTKSMCPTWQSGYSLGDCRPLSFGCLASDFRVNWLTFDSHCHRKVACRCVAPCL